MVMDSYASAQYGSREMIGLSIPHKDLAFAKELAKRMGWELII